MEQYNELEIKVSKYSTLFEDFIVTLTDGAIEISQESILVRNEDDLSEVVYGIKEFAKQLSEHFDEEITCSIDQRKKENIDWYKKYQESVNPIEVGSFYVHPSWHEGKNNSINIIVDPALAFGSGHHATTNSCLGAIESYVKKDDELLDVGCGSGILSIAASKLGAVVDICDSDEQAIISAHENFEKNSETYASSWIGSVGKREKEYDVVLANIIADVLIMLSKDLKSALKDNGVLILSGILNKYEDKVLEKFKELKLIKRVPQDEWITLVFQKENSIDERQ